MENGIEQREQPKDYKTLLLTSENWQELKVDFIKLAHDCFPELSPESIEEMFTKTFSKDTVMLLEDESEHRLIGFTQAHIYSQSPELANIGMTGISPDKRGQGLVGILIGKLEEELKSKGVKYITRESRIKDGYADAIERHYGDRIIEKSESDIISRNPTRHFKIKL